MTDEHENSFVRFQKYRAICVNAGRSRFATTLSESRRIASVAWLKIPVCARRGLRPSDAPPFRDLRKPTRPLARVSAARGSTAFRQTPLFAHAWPHHGTPSAFSTPIRTSPSFRSGTMTRVEPEQRGPEAHARLNGRWSTDINSVDTAEDMYPVPPYARDRHAPRSFLGN